MSFSIQSNSFSRSESLLDSFSSSEFNIKQQTSTSKEQIETIETSVDSINLDLISKILFLTQDEANKILKLNYLVSFDKVLNFLLSKFYNLLCNQAPEIPFLLKNTLLFAAEKNLESPSSKYHYHHKLFIRCNKKSEQISLPFIISNSNELLISFYTIEARGDKKISYAINLNSGEKLVKSSVEGVEKINDLIRELKLQSELSLDNSYIHAHHTLCQKTVIQRKKCVEGLPQKKMIYFEKYYPKTVYNVGILNLNDTITLIKTILLGINLIHSAGYVHCDLKRESFFLEDEIDQVKIADYSYTVTIGSKIKGYSREYADPTLLIPPSTSVIHYAYPYHDAYAMGIALLEILLGNSFNLENPRGFYNTQSKKMREKTLKTAKKQIKNFNYTVHNQKICKKIFKVGVKLLRSNLKNRYSCYKAYQKITEIENKHLSY